ncbi:phosphonoacetaldehyde reductase [Natronospira bacteriovora]|uniref:Phosphonoacetaldehyde reductase n=1 Tax=Natronospira bacteriovora TaxID=3069753 RepID=A0ABU0W792_9GAMM|nr:phosphonoacetaldehyde reductase [Natronospira sp. AB-CW4]MDQ2069903.1 phosphonoacetaldehyde reductase [Natronospira sp. AB-CW4]
MSNSAWTYQNPVKVVFEPGVIDHLAEQVDGERVVLITTPGFRRRGVVDRLSASLGSRLVAVVDDVKPNPDVRDVDTQGQALRQHAPDMLLALGGGSSMDTAKGLARLLSQPGDASLTRHFRDGQAFSSEGPALPVTAIPTTSGTGAEVTPFGTIWDFELGKKYSVTGADLYSAAAILDPELTVGLPEEVTISSGLDAISHALESTWNKSASPVTLGFCAKSLQLSLAALPRLKQDPGNLQARGDMMQASLLAGLAISQTRTALAHSISYPLTTRFELPHGFACSFTLPALMRFNAASDDGRLLDLARAIGFDSIDAFSGALERLFDELDVGHFLRRYIPSPDAALALSEQMFTPGRADNNLRAATQEDVVQILRDSLDRTLG